MALKTQILHDSQARAIVYIANDAGTAVTLAKTDFSPVPTELWLERVTGACSGQSVTAAWDADTDVPAFVLPDTANVDLDFSDAGGLRNTGGTGKTGSIILTSVGWASGDAFVAVLYLIKKYT